MASSAMITVPTTASRFALLQIDSDSDSDTSEPGKTTTKTGRDSAGKPRQGKAGAVGGKSAQGNDKKKDKKKKKKEQQQSEANEVSERQETIIWTSASMHVLHPDYICCFTQGDAMWTATSFDLLNTDVVINPGAARFILDKLSPR